MDWTGCRFVESVPDRLSGVPVVVGSRVQANAILIKLDDGISADDVADLFELDENSVRGVLAFAGRLKEVAA